MVTHILIGINVLVFALMVYAGGTDTFTNPSISSLLSFGASSSPHVLENGEVWRLLTSNYVHIGLPHLLFNMWCLYSIGLALEHFMGSIFFFLIF